jgi:hypothetical protein
MRDGPSRFHLRADEAREFADAPSRYSLLSRLLRSSHGGRMI